MGGSSLDCTTGSSIGSGPLTSLMKTWISLPSTSAVKSGIVSAKWWTGSDQDKVMSPTVRICWGLLPNVLGTYFVNLGSGERASSSRDLILLSWGPGEWQRWSSTEWNLGQTQ